MEVFQVRVYRCIKLQEVINKFTNQKNEKLSNNRINTLNIKKIRITFIFLDMLNLLDIIFI